MTFVIMILITVTLIDRLSKFLRLRVIGKDDYRL